MKKMMQDLMVAVTFSVMAIALWAQYAERDMALSFSVPNFAFATLP